MDILFNFEDKLITRSILVPWADPNVDVIKAGTPLDDEGAISNDGDAVGIVLNDVPKDWGRQIERDGLFYGTAEIVTAGYLDLASAEASFGQAYTDALKEKLSDIVFVDESLGGGSGLPEIEAGDDGKVLTVDDGEAVWSAPSGGGEIVYFEVATNKGGVTTDVTYSDVGSAFDSGAPVLLVVKNGTEDVIYQTPLVAQGASVYDFFVLSYTAGGILVDRYSVNTSNEWSMTSMTITGTWS